MPGSKIPGCFFVQRGEIIQKSSEVLIFAPKYVKINISNFGGLCYGNISKTVENS